MLDRPGVVARIGFKALTQLFLCGAVRSMYLDVVISLACFGEGLKLLENWRGASFADLIHQTGFGEPGKGAPHGDEDTRFAAHT